MAEIVSKLFSDNDESESAKVDKNIIESDASSFGRKKQKKAKLAGKERTRAISFAEIIADVFFEKKDSEKKDTSLSTKISGNTPAVEARKPVSGKAGKMPKKGGILGKLKGVGGAVGGIVAAAAALALLVGVGPIPGVLPNLAKIDWMMIGKAFVILGGLALVGKLMGAGGKGMIYMAGALGILAGIGPIPGVLENLANIDWGMIGKGFVILASLGLVGKLMGSGGKGMLFMAGALGILAGIGPIPGVLENLANINWGMIGKAFVILGGLALVGKLMKKGSIGILAAAAALALLAGIGPIPGVLENMANIDWATIGKSFVILGGIALAGKLMQKGAVGLLLGAAALTLLVRGALEPLQEIEWSTIGKALVALVGFGVVGAIMGKFSPFILLGALAIAALGVALIPFAYAMGLFSEAVAKLSPAIEAASKVIDSFGGIFTRVFNGMAKVIKSTAVPLRELNKTLKQLTKMDGSNLFGVAAGIAAIGASLVALSGGNLIGNAFDAVGSVFGADSPIQKLIKLGEVAGDINLLGDSFDNVLIGFKEFFNYLDDVEMGALNDLTIAVYALVSAQTKSIYLFKQMAGGFAVSKLFGFSLESNKQTLLRPTASNTLTSSKKDPIKKLTQVVEALQVQLQTLTAYSRQTTDNTGKTVEAIKNIKLNNTTVVPGGNEAQKAVTNPESLPNSRADYSSSPYSIAVPAL